MRRKFDTVRVSKQPRTAQNEFVIAREHQFGMIKVVVDSNDYAHDRRQDLHA